MTKDDGEPPKPSKVIGLLPLSGNRYADAIACVSMVTEFTSLGSDMLL
mgnify:CR=1 FL=1